MFPTYEVAIAYLTHQHSGTFGKVFYIPGSIDEAAQFITQLVDGINAIRNLALGGRGLHEAAKAYEELRFPVNTKHLLAGENDE